MAFANHAHRIAAGVTAVGLLLVATACEDLRAPVEPVAEPAPTFAVAHAGQAGGNSHFFFLPPMVKEHREYAGIFDAAISPVVEICEWNGAECGALVARFNPNGHGAQRVRADQDSEHYIVNWNSRASALDDERTYRIRVLVAGTELGHADVDVVSSGRELRSVDTAEYVGLVNGTTLPIKFRIEQGAVFVMGSGGGTASTPDGSVTLAVPAGALNSEVGVTIQPSTTHPTDPRLAPGTAYDFGPDGLRFAVPAQLSISYEPTQLPPGISETLLRLHKLIDGAWVEVPGSSAAPGVISGPIDGFSTYGVAALEPVASVTVTPSPVNLEVGQSMQLTARTYAADGTELTGRDITWAILQPGVATISSAGLVQAVATGSTTATATSEGAAGSAAVQVTSSFPAGQIAFSAAADGVLNIYTVNTDGTGLTRLTYPETGAYPQAPTQPSWYPDGNWIVYAGHVMDEVMTDPLSPPQHNYHSDLFVMRADGSNNYRLLTEPDFQNLGPAHAPVSNKIAYTSIRWGVRGLHILNHSSSEAVVTGDMGRPSWSPDESKLIIDGNLSPDQGWGIFVVELGGAGSPTWVTHGMGPAWSPDGTNVAFWRTGASTGESSILVSRIDGSGEVKLSPAGVRDREPAWSSDGQWITFVRNGNELFIMRADGSAATKILQLTGSIHGPVWRPGL